VVFRDFFAEHAYLFVDAPQIMGEQDMDQYAIFTKYLKVYENTLTDYIESLDVSIEDFFFQLEDIKNDPKVEDKKLLHFCNYLLACTDYPAFYKVMVRAAKKLKNKKGGDSKSDSKAEAKSVSSHISNSPGSKAEGKETSEESESKYDSK
jgi:hypothetical protein